MPTTRIPYGVLDGRYVNAAGDTMLGELTLAGAPTLDLHAATKKYVDDADAAFLRKDGSVALTANWDIGDTRKILADGVRARDAAGLELYDDANNGIFIEDGGRVGIGTAYPRRRLDIVDESNPQLRLTHTDETKFADFQVDTNHDLRIKPSSTGQIVLQPTADSTDFFQVLDADGGAPILSVDSVNERVGIGTASPGGRLHIAASVEGELVESVIENTNAVSGAAGFSFKTVSREWKMGVNIYDQFRIRDHTSDKNPLVIQSGADSYCLYITNGSKVGIGTAYPSRKLDITDASNPQLRLTHTYSSIYTDFQTVSGGYLYINPSGNRVGIGTFSPSQALEVAGSAVVGAHDSYHKLYVSRFSSSGYSFIAAGDTDRDIGVGLAFEYRNDNGSLATGISIDTNGKVGIGITPPAGPARKLEIVDPSASQLRLTQLANTNYVDFLTNVNGDLTITPSGSKVLMAKALEVDGAFDHDGPTFGVFGVTPAIRIAPYTVTNAITDRSFDANNTTVAELADVVATIINDLKTYGFFQ